jgi:hypothetical protein
MRTHPTLNDPPWGPTPLPRGARRLLERLRDQGPAAITGDRPTALQTRLARLGYIQAGPRPGSFGEATRWIEITTAGRLVLSPLE